MNLTARWVKAGPALDQYQPPAPTCNTPPTASDMQAQGYLWYDQLSDLPAAQDGYAIENVRFVDAGSGRAALQWDTYSVAERATKQAAEAQTAEANRQAAKSPALQKVENQFLAVCELLTGSRTKLGFEELEQRISAIAATSKENAESLTLTLFKINAQGVREGGTLWWDDCVWHEGVQP